MAIDLNGKIEPRRYQEMIFNTATLKNTLCVLPTGMGKTMIAAMLAVQRLKQYPKGKIIFLAPTRPLAQQHQRTFLENISIFEEETALFTGTVSPEKRKKQFDDAVMIFSTPQGLENDLISNRISLKDVSLLVFDEAHRAVGNYSYVYIAKRYNDQAEQGRVLALTASPGTDTEKITEVCQNLFIEEIEVRREQDSDVAPYIQEIDINWIEVPFPEELKVVQKDLKQCYDEKLHAVHKYGYLNVPPSQATKTTLLQAQGGLHGEMARGNRAFELLKSISLLAEALKIQHALELVETQGIQALKNYLDQLRHQSRTTKTKATQNLVKDPLFKSAYFKTEKLLENATEHPKLREVKRVLLKELYANKEAKVIVFTQYRDTATTVSEGLKKVGIESVVFVGQAKKGATGMSQKEQRAVLDRFADGEFPVLIATSVAEEGLDIPKVDMVLFYEPVPSAIRTVQRRGRTGRLEKGKVIMLVTKGTRDVGYRWTAHHKEKRMYRAIASVKKNFRLTKNKKNTKQESLSSFEKKGGGRGTSYTIVADHREKGSLVLKELVDMGVHVDLQQLEIGDYQASNRVVVEYKNVRDFVDSIIDGRLLIQLKNLKRYTRPILLLEGDEDLYAQRKIHPNAIRGMLATVAVSYNIPIIRTMNARESAGILYAIARREQSGGQEFQYHTGKPLNDAERLEYVVAAIPGIGSQLAKPLLERFRTIKNLANAEIAALMEVPGIGKKKAEAIHEIVRMKWEQRQ